MQKLAGRWQGLKESRFKERKKTSSRAGAGVFSVQSYETRKEGGRCVTAAEMGPNWERNVLASTEPDGVPG